LQQNLEGCVRRDIISCEIDTASRTAFPSILIQLPGPLRGQELKMEEYGLFAKGYLFNAFTVFSEASSISYSFLF